MGMTNEECDACQKTNMIAASSLVG